MDIDWDKPYGVIYGNHDGRYEQGGIYFDIHGREVYSPQKILNGQKSKKAWAEGIF